MFRFCAAFLLTALALSVYAAPAPLARQPRPIEKEEVVGKWNYDYSGTKGYMIFYADGTYYSIAPDANKDHPMCHIQSPEYSGKWDVKDGNIILQERYIWVDIDTGIKSVQGDVWHYTYKLPKTSIPKGKVTILKGTSHTERHTADVVLERAKD